MRSALQGNLHYDWLSSAFQSSHGNSSASIMMLSLETHAAPCNAKARQGTDSVCVFCHFKWLGHNLQIFSVPAKELYGQPSWWGEDDGDVYSYPHTSRLVGSDAPRSAKNQPQPSHRGKSPQVDRRGWICGAVCAKIVVCFFSNKLVCLKSNRTVSCTL